MTVKKSKIPYFFFVFFAVIFVVNIIYIYVSQKTWRGIVTQDAYHKGLHYNDVIAEAKKQKELGWEMQISYKNFGAKKGEVKVILTDKNGAKISDAEVTITLKRPIQEGVDFTKKLFLLEKAYQAEIEFPFAGQWDFLVIANTKSASFKESKRYVVQ